jgi:lysophospholipase L1-like esterase
LKTILCFGDSNTWGHVPGSEDDRYPWEVRWPGVLQAELGDGWRVLEEGLNGRTTLLDDPLSPYRNGRDYLLPCLESHTPLDLVVVFLGTNDLHDRFALPPVDIARAAAILAEDVCAARGGPQALVLGLPRLGANLGESMSGAAAKAAELPRCFREAAAEAGVPLLDLSEVVAYSDIDGIHLDAEGHRAVGRAVAARVREVLD